MSDEPRDRCPTPRRRARLGAAGIVLALAALVGSAPWVAEALGSAPAGPGEVGTILAVSVAIVLAVIAVGEAVVAALSNAARRAVARGADAADVSDARGRRSTGRAGGHP